MNGLSVVTAGAAMLVFAGPFARVIGLADRGVLAIIGLLLFAFGFDELAVALGRHLRRADLRLFALADVAWVGVAGAVLALGGSALTFLERSLVAAVAAVLAWFALAGFRAARSL